MNAKALNANGLNANGLNANVLEPGSTIGIVGGGQLGRMLALEARRLGYHIHVLDPAADAPASVLADKAWTQGYDDRAGAEAFAAAVDVITFEFENIPPASLEAMAAVTPVFPSPQILQTCRERDLEKAFLVDQGIDVAPYRVVRSADEVKAAAKTFNRPCILKTASLGYDGKGQIRLEANTDSKRAWAELAKSPGMPVSAAGAPGKDEGPAKDEAKAVLETKIDFEREFSVIVARNRQGESLVYPIFENEHLHHVLDVTISPMRIDTRVEEEAKAIALSIAGALDLVGVLCVEMFLLPDQTILVNELAPRPHNSGHLTLNASITSQFEQQLRAVCGLPLGDPSLLKPAAMVNLLGDLWTNGPPPWRKLLGLKDIKLHLYGKSAARPGRKMGHLVALADTPKQARTRALDARELLRS